MARDSRIRMRDGLAIPGALLVFYGLLAILYAEEVRARSNFCAETSRILIAGLCYSVWKLILPLVLVGVGLMITGLVAFRGRPRDLEGHLHHGTPSHMSLAFLVSFLVVPAAGWITQTIRERGGEPFELTILGTRFEHTFLLELAFVVGLLMFVPYFFLYLGIHKRRRDFMRAAEDVLDEEAMPEAAYAYEDTSAASHAQAGDMVPEEKWPASRDGEPGVVTCMASDNGRSCREPVRAGTRYCIRHGCLGQTQEGRPCRNQAGPGGLCPVHAASASPPGP